MSTFEDHQDRFDAMIWDDKLHPEDHVDPPVADDPPPSGRVVAALVQRVEEALTPWRDGTVPGGLSHAAVLGNLVRAVEPLLAALSRAPGSPLAASVLAAAAKASHDPQTARRVAAGKVVDALRRIGGSPAEIAGTIMWALAYMDNSGELADRYWRRIDAECTDAKRVLRARLYVPGITPEDREALADAAAKIDALTALL